MVRFVLRRLVYLVLVLVGITFVTYVVFFAGNADDLAARFAGRTAGPTAVADAKVRLGLDHGFWFQYGHYLWGLLHGSFGLDYQNQVPIGTEIGRAFPVTLSLVGGGTVLWLLIGIPIGIVGASRPRSIRDRAGTAFALTFLSMPNFVLGLLLLWLLAFELSRSVGHWFPLGGYVGPTQSVLQWLVHMILPWITLSLVQAAIYTRLVRSSLLDALSEEYVRTARAKGLSRRAVIYRHGMRAALTPLVTQLGVDVGTLLAGAVVVERVFGLNGLGVLGLNAIFNGDLPVVAATVILAATFIVVTNSLVDVVYSLLDPRVRLA